MCWILLRDAPQLVRKGFGANHRVGGQLPHLRQQGSRIVE